MGSLAFNLRAGSPVHRVEEGADGFAIVRLKGREQAFNALARQALDSAGDEFVALPVSDGAMGYERVLIIPIE